MKQRTGQTEMTINQFELWKSRKSRKRKRRRRRRRRSRRSRRKRRYTLISQNCWSTFDQVDGSRFSQARNV